LCNASNKYLRFSSPTRIYNSELDPTSESVDNGPTAPHHSPVCLKESVPASQSKFRSFYAIGVVGRVVLVGLCW
jgi:hypothetical protein